MSVPSNVQALILEAARRAFADGKTAQQWLLALQAEDLRAPSPGPLVQAGGLAAQRLAVRTGQVAGFAAERGVQVLDRGSLAAQRGLGKVDEAVSYLRSIALRMRAGQHALSELELAGILAALKQFWQASARDAMVLILRCVQIVGEELQEFFFRLSRAVMAVFNIAIAPAVVRLLGQVAQLAGVVARTVIKVALALYSVGAALPLGLLEAKLSAVASTPPPVAQTMAVLLALMSSQTGPFSTSISVLTVIEAIHSMGIAISKGLCLAIMQAALLAGRSIDEVLRAFMASGLRPPGNTGTLEEWLGGLLLAAMKGSQVWLDAGEAGADLWWRAGVAGVDLWWRAGVGGASLWIYAGVEGLKLGVRGLIMPLGLAFELAARLLIDARCSADHLYVSLKAAYAPTRQQMARVLKAAGADARFIADKFKNSENASRDDVARALKDAGFDVGDSARAIKDAFGAGLADVARALKNAGWGMGDVAGVLAGIYNMPRAAVDAALRAAGLM